MSGAAITGAFVLAAMGAFFLLSGRHEQFARISISVGVVGALIFSLFQIFPTGDRAARNVAEHQPAAFAAMEGLFETENGAPLVIIGNPNSLTVDNAAAGSHTLKSALIWWPIGMALAAVYFVFAYRMFFRRTGKPQLGTE